MRLAILLIACIGLSALVYFDAFFSQEEKEITQNTISGTYEQAGIERGKKQPLPTPQNPYQNLKVSALKETRIRPLFTQSRKAPPPPRKIATLPKITKRPPKKETVYFLMGILKNGTRSVALLQEKDTGKYFRVGKGDILGSNLVTDILLKEIKIEKEDGTSSTLKLRFKK